MQRVIRAGGRRGRLLRFPVRSDRTSTHDDRPPQLIGPEPRQWGVPGTNSNWSRSRQAHKSYGDKSPRTYEHIDDCHRELCRRGAAEAGCKPDAEARFRIIDRVGAGADAAAPCRQLCLFVARRSPWPLNRRCRRARTEMMKIRTGIAGMADRMLTVHPEYDWNLCGANTATGSYLINGEVNWPIDRAIY